MTRLHNAELVNYECGRMNPLLCPRHHRQVILAVKTYVRPPIGLFYIERDPHSRMEIGEIDIVLSAQE